MRFPSVILLLLVAVSIGHGTPVTSKSKHFHGIRNLFKEPPPPPVSSFDGGISGRAVSLLAINMPVDQFNATNEDTYPMWYYQNNEYYVPGGPLFIYIGGEWSISQGWVQSGHMYDMAKEMNGMIYYTEHRYYGASFPTSDASTENLRYLDVDQALADLAYFVDYQRANLEGAANSGVIVVGASYSATMAAWFRQRYPDKANGAWASSAPLLAQLDFPEYMQTVSWAMGDVGGAECSSRIEEAFAEIEAAIARRDVASMTAKFNLCEDIRIDDDLDVWNFVSAIAYEFAGLVQYHWTGDIEGVCDVLTDSSLDALSALAKWIGQIYGGYCVDAGYQSMIDFYKDPSWTSPSTQYAMRQWFYQTCNEFGWYQTAADGSTQIFGSSMPLQLSLQMCKDLYDDHFDAIYTQYKIDRTNRNHNGMTPTATNVFYTHGSVDPWRPMGVQKDVSESSPVVILEGYSHCADLYSISASDSAQMRATKERVTASVRQWLGL